MFKSVKYIDLDGDADIGSTVFVDVDADGTYNAANDIPLEGDIKLFSERDEAQINIVDMLGRTVKSFYLEVDRDWNNITVDISDLPSGTYNVQKIGDRKAHILIIQE